MKTLIGLTFMALAVSMCSATEQSSLEAIKAVIWKANFLICTICRKMWNKKKIILHDFKGIERRNESRNEG